MNHPDVDFGTSGARGSVSGMIAVLGVDPLATFHFKCNGLKFYPANGEISKVDETTISGTAVNASIEIKRTGYPSSYQLLC